MKAALVLLAFVSCDGQPVHELDPTWSRMMEQKRADSYGVTSAFDDGMVMRAPPKGTRAIGIEDDDAPAPKITRASMVTGRERFEALCAACHGVAGDGDSVVATKMKRKPPSFTEPRLFALSAREIHDVARDGYGLMPSYASKLDPEERWDVAYYVLALRRSRRVEARTLPPDLRAELEREEGRP